MNPTRHIMKEKDSELAIFCSGKKQNGPNSPHYEEKKFWIGHHLFWKKTKWTQLATLWRKKNSELANILFLEKQLDPTRHIMKKKKFWTSHFILFWK